MADLAANAARSANHSTESRGLKFQILYLIIGSPWPEYPARDLLDFRVHCLSLPFDMSFTLVTVSFTLDLFVLFDLEL